jgi:hypothetical protein
VIDRGSIAPEISRSIAERAKARRMPFVKSPSFPRERESRIFEKGCKNRIPVFTGMTGERI